MPAMSLQSIVCGVDFSKASAAALKTAAALAYANGGQLTVVFVDDPLLVAAAKAAHDLRGGPAPALEELKRFISQSLDEESLVSDTQATIAVGEPATELFNAARQAHAGLLVLGTHGSGRGTRLLFGSTLTRVLHLARLPVLVVPS